MLNRCHSTALGPAEWQVLLRGIALVGGHRSGAGMQGRRGRPALPNHLRPGRSDARRDRRGVDAAAQVLHYTSLWTIVRFNRVPERRGRPVHTIEVDFDVLKALMLRRPNESVSNNDVLRKLLELPPAGPLQRETSAPATADWIVKGVRFCAGWEFRAKHHGRTYHGRVADGALVLEDDTRHDSPSSAAVSITKYAVNGWNFWECRTSSAEPWRPLSSFRR